MAENLIDASNALKSKCYDMVREYFDDLGVNWVSDDLADAWIDFVRGVSDGINEMVAAVIDARVVFHAEQREKYAALYREHTELMGGHSEVCPDCIADADAIGNSP